jgi:hypothetical protein
MSTLLCCCFDTIAHDEPLQPRPVGTYPWLYGKLSRQQTEEILHDYGMQQGLFLVRESSQP